VRLVWLALPGNDRGAIVSMIDTVRLARRGYMESGRRRNFGVSTARLVFEKSCGKALNIPTVVGLRASSPSPTFVAKTAVLDEAKASLGPRPSV
jgi:hypothetical protein